MDAGSPLVCALCVCVCVCMCVCVSRRRRIRKPVRTSEPFSLFDVSTLRVVSSLRTRHPAVLLFSVALAFHIYLHIRHRLLLCRRLSSSISFSAWFHTRIYGTRSPLSPSSPPHGSRRQVEEDAADEDPLLLLLEVVASLVVAPAAPAPTAAPALARTGAK